MQMVKSESGAQTISFMNLMVGWVCKIYERKNLII
jgi:hypothetical protein